LIVVEQDTPLPDLFPKDLVLNPQVLDDLVLFTVNPSGGEDQHQELPRLEEEIHDCPDAVGR
jgi:hypothetical protein